MRLAGTARDEEAITTFQFTSRHEKVAREALAKTIAKPNVGTARRVPRARLRIGRRRAAVPNPSTPPIVDAINTAKAKMAHIKRGSFS